MENGMLFELRGRSGGRDRILFAGQATVLPFVILMTTMSCSRPDMPAPTPGILDQWFSGSVIDPANTQWVRPDEEQPKVQRERPKKTSASRKVAVVHAPKPTGTSVSRPASKKAGTPPSKKASTPPRPDTQDEQQLFQEFLEWRKRQNDLP
jgi:hypothetical protein